MDPGSNMHVINSGNWIGWTRERNEEHSQSIMAGKQRIPVTAWDRMNLMVNSPSGVSSTVITHVALVEGFLTSLVALTCCRTVKIHFDSGRDLLYHGQPSNPIVELEY
jgi:hypothetical protein